MTTPKYNALRQYFRNQSLASSPLCVAINTSKSLTPLALSSPAWDSRYFGWPAVASPLLGDVWVSGQGAWVAWDTEQWLALGCAVDAERIDKAAIRLAFEHSPIRDIPAYVQAVEAAYRDLFVAWCQRGR